MRFQSEPGCRETVYAALLYPERFQQIEKLFNQESDRKSVLRAAGFESIIARVKRISDEFINSRSWGDYLLAGFSVSLCQLTSALYIMKRIKKIFPKLIIVIGGSTFSGSATDDFFKLFPEVDAVINGEGELPFTQLIDYLTKFPNLSSVFPIKGLSKSKTDIGHKAPVGFQQITSLNSLPPPDYDEYFDLLPNPSIHIMCSFLCCLWKHPVAAGGGNQMGPPRPTRKCRDVPPAARFATLTSSGKAIALKNHRRWSLKSIT